MDDVRDIEEGSEDVDGERGDAASRPARAHGWFSRRRLGRLATIGCTLLGVALVADACSSTPGIGVAGATDGTTTTAALANNQPSRDGAANAAAMLSYSQCMQSHGVSDFPDPNAQGQIALQGGPNSDLNPDNPTFQAAQRACQSKMPAPPPGQQAKALKNALKVSQCMRDHGIKDFPDPSSSGGGISMRINGSPGSDLNPSDPLFQAAQKACMPNAPKLRSGTGPGTSSGSASSGSSLGIG
jgi:hypothetical protein